VPLLLADREEGRAEFHRPLREERGDERQLGAVDVPHGGEVVDERAGGGPERALLGREARLDERVVQRGREHRLPVGGRSVDRDGLQLLAPRLLRAITPLREPVGPDPAVATEVLTRLLDTTQREADAHLDALAGLARTGPHEAERPQRRW